MRRVHSRTLLVPPFPGQRIAAKSLSWRGEEPFMVQHGAARAYTPAGAAYGHTRAAC